MKKNILLITPPLSQLNTPYPATAYLTGFLSEKNYHVQQLDLSIKLFLKIFSSSGLEKIFSSINFSQLKTPLSKRIYNLADDYLTTIDAVIFFLQGKDNTLSYKICSRNYLPESPRFEQLEEISWQLGVYNIDDQAKLLATLYLEDLCDFISENVDQNFSLTKYAEKISLSATDFAVFEEALSQDLTIIEKFSLEILRTIDFTNIDLIAFSIPFPGNLFSALRLSKFIKETNPQSKIVFGGGYVNTELRRLKATSLFKYIDFVTLDDGELPLLQIMKFLNTEIDSQELKRTFMLTNNEVKFYNCNLADFKLNDLPAPDYTGINKNDYLQILDSLNPMHRLWSDGFWNKLTLAHGCYWANCAFCDTSLDYIKRYDPHNVDILLQKIKQLIAQNKCTGFHFVDEAAPPALLKEMSLALLKEKIQISWWTNIRFEKSYSYDLCRLLAASGCIAVAGGMEVSHDRLLNLINKGVNIEQGAKAAANLTNAGILTHAYLMFGFPTETTQETIDSLEIVRQFFANGILYSGFWHQFSLTAHSGVAQNCKKFKVKVTGPEFKNFAYNDLWHSSENEPDHRKFSKGLNKALFNYMHQNGFELPLNTWFDFNIPKTKVKKDCIAKILKNNYQKPQDNQKLLWLGGKPRLEKRNNYAELFLHHKNAESTIQAEFIELEWFKHILEKTSTYDLKVKIKDLCADFEQNFQQPADSLWQKEYWQDARTLGLLLL